jgi:hypothetical protein
VCFTVNTVFCIIKIGWWCCMGEHTLIFIRIVRHTYIYRMCEWNAESAYFTPGGTCSDHQGWIPWKWLRTAIGAGVVRRRKLWEQDKCLYKLGWLPRHCPRTDVLCTSVFGWSSRRSPRTDTVCMYFTCCIFEETLDWRKTNEVMITPNYVPVLFLSKGLWRNMLNFWYL